MSTSKTLTLNSSELFLQSQNPLPSSLPPFPANFPPSKLIPKTRFIVDGFRNSGEFSLSYFLSHFHSDHYTGLTSTWSRGIVFCSETTARLVVKVLGVSASFVVGLPIDDTVVIDDCEVTLIDANHCPGAVQFLFKVPVNGGKFERYVHTGDFRFCDDTKLMPKLSEFVGCDAVFLDTTYCDPKFLFPLQEESIDYVVSVIDRIRSENRDDGKNVLFLVATYVIGKERILLEISRRCGCKIHVDSRKMGILRALGYEDEGVFTEDESASDVHVVGWNVLGETWPYFRPNFVKMSEIMVEKDYKKVVGFVPTGWTYEVKRNKFAVRTKDSFEIHLVPYSEHSNYNELREYVRFLKPKRVLPTVGSDVENVDSKHAIKMQKHFAGLVDEMANKHEFLMGFYRAPQGKAKVKVDDPLTELDKGVEHFKEEFDVSTLDYEHKIDSGSVCPVDPMDDPGSQIVASLSDKEKEEIMQELRDCLPTWVSVDQMLELIKTYGRNIVDAVSHFYEHETEFYEQIVKLFPSSLSNLESQSTTFHNPCSVDNSLQTLVKSPNQKAKFLPLKQSVASSVSPGKRKKNSENKKSKKGKINSNLESGGIKQSTITKFFSKNTSVCQGSIAGPLSGTSTEDTNLSSEHSAVCYKEELAQFIQIIDGSESMKNFAAELLQKAEGNVGLALDMYYNNSEAHLGGNQKSIDVNSKLLPCEVPDESLSCQGKERSETGNKIYQSAQDSLVDNIAVNYVSLPPEKYSPIEHACWKQGQPAPYLHLARTFDIVEGEKGKIKATSMLSNMFRSLLVLSPEDVLPAIYLCTNKIAADHENMELNIGGSLVASALEEACGTNRAKIRERYNNLGDLGDVAQECRQSQSLLLPPSPLLIREVYSVLQKISIQTGSGSMGRRKGLIVGMMRSCREKEMKFLVRTLVRNLRIGAMMRTVLPALAQAVALNCYDGAGKNQKELLQGLSAAVVEAYNILPDLNILVPSLMSKGIKFSATALAMVPGIPIRPMLAKITNGVAQALKLFQNRAFTCEYKYDGQRAQIHKLDNGSVRIFSRKGDETTSKFPDLVHIIQDLCKPSAESFIIDAEVVGIDRKNGNKFISFQELSARERGSKASSVSLDRIKVDICVHVFDVMLVNGEKLLPCSLRERRQCMNGLFRGNKPGYLEYAKELTVEADEAHPDCEATLMKINAFLEDAFQSSCEGIMVKSLDVDAGYFASKRADTWLKVKRDYMDGVGDSLDLVPIGAWHGNGRKAGWYSPFLMACYNPDTEEFESVCRVMSGFTDAFYKEMKEFLSGDKILIKKPLYYRTDEVPDMWFSAELVWEIRGADLTVSPVHKAAVGIVHPSRGISMRFPRFIRTRPDRQPEDCSTSSETAEMFHSQTRKMDVSGVH
ncbi:DNA ligase 6-like isoform X2 [Chenopodium quinoa]|uniref:DNA ligase 6-like isoform X2 n=1 Tax=Chenopodium quinoa TaxID=63459 RepID=UPI000B794A71|nr:DNA ligase 6-like isoform X2 [Chenopodium quinoa]